MLFLLFPGHEFGFFDAGYKFCNLAAYLFSSLLWKRCFQAYGCIALFYVSFKILYPQAELNEILQFFPVIRDFLVYVDLVQKFLSSQRMVEVHQSPSAAYSLYDPHHPVNVKLHSGHGLYVLPLELVSWNELYELRALA